MHKSNIFKAVFSIITVLTVFFSFSDNSLGVCAVGRQSSYSDQSKEKAESLCPKVYDLGGAAAISYNKLKSGYSCRIVYKKDGVTHTLFSQTNGFFYIDDLKKGTVYHAKLIWSNGETVHSELFEIGISRDKVNTVSFTDEKTDSISFFWENFAPKQIYSVYRSFGGKTVKLGETKETSYTDKNLKAGKKYTYIIRVKRNDKSDIKTDETKASHYTSPAEPSFANTDLRSGTLRWSNSDGAGGYFIYRLENGEKNYSYYKEVIGKTYAEISANGICKYGVMAYIRNPDGSLSLSKMTAADILPERPSGLSGTNIRSGVRLSWNKASKNATYHVYCSLEKNGTYKLISSTKDTVLNINIPSDSKSRYFMVMFIDGGYKSSFSEIYEAYAAKRYKLFASTALMSDPSWSGEKITEVKKGSYVSVMGKVGSFYRCMTNGKNGFVYERAINGAKAPDTSKLNEKNLDAYLNDILYNIERSPKGIWNYVNKMKYNSAKKDTRITDIESLTKHRRELAVNMIKNNAGMCYHYAAISAELFKKAGYKVKLVYCPHTNGGFHCYNYALINGKWQLFDACRNANNNDLGYLPQKKNYMSYRKLNTKKEEISDII